MLRIPRTSLIVLCGVAGCGKSTFASNNFKAMEIVSSDRCRAMISDNEENMAVSKEAFELFHLIIEKRMKAGRLVVADSTALSHEARKKLLQLAKHNAYHIILICFDVPLEAALSRNSMRERKVSGKVIEKQYYAFKRALKNIGSEGYDEIIILDEQKGFDFKYEILESDDVKKSSEFYENIMDFGRPQDSFVLKSRSGARVKMEQKDVEEAVKTLYSCLTDPSWMIYIPPVIPCISAQNMWEQVYGALKYFRSRGVHRMIFEERVTRSVSVVIICRDEACSRKYFSSGAEGEIYSVSKDFFIDQRQKSDLIYGLHEVLVRSGYFAEHDTDFIIFEGSVFQDNYPFIVPYRLLSYSSLPLYKQDNIWQMENIRRLCSYSKLLHPGREIVIDDKTEIQVLMRRLEIEGYNEFIIKPVRAFPYYKGELIQPEILCKMIPDVYGENSFQLSASAYDLSLSGLDKFLKNSLSGEYLQYSAGCIALNKRICGLKN